MADRALFSGVSAPRQRRDPREAAGLLRLWTYHSEGTEQLRDDLLGLSASESGVSDRALLRTVPVGVEEALRLREVERGRSADASTSASDGRRLPQDRGAS